MVSIDVALVNGKVYTLDGKVCEAVAILGDKIYDIGSNNDIRTMRDNKTEILDLKGKTVFPGFNDSHMHLLLYGSFLDKVDLRGAKSINEIIDRTKNFIVQNNKKPGEWILGWGWDQNLFPDKKFPNSKILDMISTQHPILLNRICGHVGVGNTIAFNNIGINKDTEINGGVIDKDEKGELTGVIREAALEWFMSCLPKPNVDQLKHLIEIALSKAIEVGLTSIQTDDLDMMGFDIFDDLLEAYDDLMKSNKLSVRIYEEIQAPHENTLKQFLEKGMRTGDGNDYFRIGPIKLIADGSLGARTAALQKEYSDDPGNYGVLTYQQEELNHLVTMAHCSDMQVAVHAIGDGALKQAIEAIESALLKEPRPTRHRIVHCQIGNKTLFKKMAKLGIAADIQPPFVSSDWDIVEYRIGSEREKESYAWKTMLDMGIKLGGGSDCPIESFNPLWGIYAAVTRKDLKGNPPGGWLPEQKLSLEQALKLYTIGSAYLSFEEDKKGTIEQGKLADIVVLEQDPFDIDPNDIKNIKVLVTIVGGKVRFIDNKAF